MLLVHGLKILPCLFLCVLFQIESKICAADILAHGLLLPAKDGKGEIFITFGCRTNIIQNGHSAFIILSEVLNQTTATTNDIQSHQIGIIFIAAKRGKNISHITFSHGSNTVQIGLADVSSSEAKYLLNGRLFDFHTEDVQHRILSGNHALVDTELFCPTAALYSLFIVDIQNVHRTVSNVCQKIRSLEIAQLIDDGRVSLREKTASDKSNVIIFAIKTEVHLLVAEQIASEIFTLFANPGQRQTGRQMNICFTDAVHIQFSGNRHQSQNIVVLIHSLVCDKFLVTFPDAVIDATILQNVAGEDRFGFIGSHSGRGNCVCRFDIAVAMIHGNDFDVIQFSHLLCTSLCLFVFIKNVPFQ